MLRALIGLSFLALFLQPGSALADNAKDRDACLKAQAKRDARLAACTQVITNAKASEADRRRALFIRGNLLVSRKKYKEAIADYDAAEKLGLADAALFRRRGFAKSRLRKWEDAIADYTASIKRDDKYSWTFYARAFAYRRAGKNDLALADLDRAVALRPNSTRNRLSRARLLMRMKEYEKATADLDSVLQRRPRYAFGYALRGRAFENLGNKQKAIHDYRLAVLLNPNMARSESALKKLVGKPAPPAQAAVPFAPPKTGTRFRYIQLTTTTAVVKSDMEESIDQLIGWFKRKKKPLPKRVSFLERRIVGTKDNAVTVNVRILRAGGREHRAPRTVTYYRALWPMLVPRIGGPAIALDYPQAALDGLWPLQVGKKAQGVGTVFAVCPEKLDMRAAMIGCDQGKPGQRVKIGTVSWKARVERQQSITVPAGVMPTTVVRYAETAKLKMLGRERTRNTLVYFWYAPKQHWWVRRTSRNGKRIAIIELTAVE